MSSEISSDIVDQPRRRRRRGSSKLVHISKRTRRILKFAGWIGVLAGVAYIAVLISIMVRDPRWHEPPYTPPPEQPAPS
jgi:hypothetical protein